VYGRRSGSASPLPGSSIKGAGSLAPGKYVGVFEKRKEGIVFVSLPAGFHDASELEILPEGTCDVLIALSKGSILLRTDGGRFVLADAQTREWLTEAYADVFSALTEGAEKKLKLSVPIINEIRRAGEIVYERAAQ